MAIADKAVTTAVHNRWFAGMMCAEMQPFIHVYDHGWHAYIVFLYVCTAEAFMQHL